MIELSLVLLLAGSLPSAEAPVGALVEARRLLMNRDYAALTALVEARQAAAAKDAAKGHAFNWTLSAFALDNSAIPSLIEEWVERNPKSWAPFLAQAVNKGMRATRARGEKWASETSDDQFRRMAGLQAGMAAACRVVLSRNRGVCPCYVELVMAAKTNSSEPDPLVGQAFKMCPLDYRLNVEHVYGLTPRWGGSYEKMLSAIDSARRRGLDPAHARNLGAYVPADRASALELDGNLDAAIAVLDQAIKGSPTALLLQERAGMNRRRKDAPGALRDANAALDLANSGWMFSAGRLTALLVDRAWALNTLGRKGDARTDVTLAIEIAPTDQAVKEWAAYLQIPAKTGLDRGAPAVSTPTPVKR